MTPTKPRTIDLKGTPRQIGVQHGSLLSTEIKRQIEVYSAMFEITSKMSWDAVLELAEEFSATINKLTPDIHEEMQGIAEGAGVDILDIVALNCRSEIALGNFSDGCTSLAWNTAPDVEGVVLAQNWDWTNRVKQNLVMISIEQAGKPKIHMITESGIVGKIGFNSAAVGVCLNAIRARPLPIHIALRVCLESTSVDGAIRRLQTLGGVASSQHILIADRHKAIGMELSPLGDVFLPEERGLVTHSNHFITNKHVDEPPWLAGSPVRLQRIRQLTAKMMDEGVSGSMVQGSLLRERVFSDTFNAPQAICCQEDPTRPIETRSSTLFNIIMSLNDKPSAEVVWGKPRSREEGEVLTMPW
ncbi:acyl-coenzyme A:6-aminopenicillanic acid acyl-transferase-domain-containing protein [Exophiala viscosa]|uniref:acyl-coenzyme A:6-aminopenicillanic acid acyl-transferase-domain-containing protein n=1 Tax=Exophiala viscosa TaxID=2486360 RepID=UPI0021947287|nr:acyl-coenzyme A:6-aminopenicillanic acid acyl-transferase-domain-containing protein [Exophiala viscosa]